MLRTLAAAAVLAVAQPAAAQTLAIPADPINAVEGEWYGETADLSVDIRGGVVTARNVKTADRYIIQGGVKDGTVVARWTGFNGAAAGNSFSGQCWTTGGEGWKLYPCREAGNISARAVDGKGFYTLYILNHTFRRKADINAAMWAARK